jgi:hypothetical protein
MPGAAYAIHPQIPSISGEYFRMYLGKQHWQIEVRCVIESGDERILEMRQLPKRLKLVHNKKILPTLLYGYEVWFLTLKEEHEL